MNEREQFVRLVARMQAIGSVPIALYGAGRVAADVCPAVGVGREVLAGIIDDDPEKVGRSWAGLPVITAKQAIEVGARAVIITARGEVQDAIWSRRRRLLQHGVQVLCVPSRFTSQLWDDCLVEQYEWSLARSRRIELVYLNDYPERDPQPPAWFMPLVREAMRSGHTVCEIGPGTGLCTEAVIEDAGAYYAVDFSARLLYEALEHRFARYLDKLHTRHDTTASLAGVPDAAVDLVFSYNVFVHFKSDLVHRFLTGIRRVLRPGGSAILHFLLWNADTIRSWRQHEEAVHVGRHGPMFYNHPDQLAASAAALGLGFEVLGEPGSQHIAGRFWKNVEGITSDQRPMTIG